MVLRLAVTKGPQQGQTLEFPPGSAIRIGRVLRGNNLTIKDSGVSSKHLSIASDLGKWILRDLGSSNGTFVNGVAADPAVGVEIHDGDVVKIGEDTSISVAIEELEASGPRRNPRRRGGATAEVEPEVVNRKPGRPRKARVSEEGSPEEKRVVTRQSNRRPKKEEIAANCSVLGEIPEDSELEAEEAKVPVKPPLPRAPRRRGKNVHQGSVTIDSPAESVSEVRAEDGASDVQPVSVVGEDRVKDGNVCEVEKSGGTGSKEGLDNVEEAGGSGSNDLENMTLGEWLDFLEAELPRQIIKASEAKIRDMRIKAQRVHDYMEQHKKKGKGKVLAV